MKEFFFLGGGGGGGGVGPLQLVFFVAANDGERLS